MFNSFISIFGNASYLIFTKKYFYFIEFFFLIPKIRIKEKIDEIITLETYPYQKKCVNTNIFLANDPWAEMGFSDWVGIKKNDQEFAVGGNNNYIEFFSEIKSSLMKMNRLLN